MATTPAGADPLAGLGARGRLIAGMCLAFANFMVILDLTIANVSIPHIAGDLGVSLEQGTWVISSYAVAEAICVPLAGWLSLRFGSVRLFIWALAGFGVFSFLCGISVSLEMLVASRIGQGLCGAPIMPMSQILMLRVFPPHQRSAAMAAWAMTVMLAPALGPIIGGVISDEMSWHWVFLINVPIALVLVAGSFILLRRAETETRKLPIDIIGLCLLVFWVACMQIMLDTGRDRGWFEDTRIVLLAIGTVIGFAAFVIWELTDKHPMVDLRLFRHPGFTFSLLCLSVTFGGFFAGMVVVPQWLQTSLGYSATTAGTVVAGHAYIALVLSAFVPRLMTRFDMRVIVAVGVGLMAASTAMRVGWTSSADYWTYSLAMLVQGFGIPLMAIGLMTMSLSSVDPDETASAAGLQNFVRTMAFAIASAVSLTGWDNAERNARGEIVANLQPDQAEAAMADAGLTPGHALEALDRMVDIEATTLALDHVFMIITALLLVAAAIILLAPKPKPMDGGPPGMH